MRGVVLVALALAAGCAAAPQDIRSMITPDAIAASTEPLLFVELTETGQQAIMSLTGRNGDVVTWSTADGRSISLQDGILVATRGFGFDLMSADVTGTMAALNGGPRQYERFASYLDGNNRTVVNGYLCEITGPTSEVINSFGRALEAQRWVERCRNHDGNQRTEFWRRNGAISRTEQELNDSAGTLVTERLTGE